MQTKQWKGNVARGLAIAAAALALSALAQGAPKYAILHNFTGGSDGNGNAGVTADQKGNVYGASLGGGSQSCGPAGCGLIFELAPGSGSGWTFTALYDFTAGRDGANPNSPLTLDTLGNLYGTTVHGGGPHGGGTAFELSSAQSGWTLTTLFRFCPKLVGPGCLDGGATQAGLARDGAGNLYGTKPGGGVGYGGTVFELTRGSGGRHETILHTFGLRQGDGERPYAGLILDAPGNLYGTTRYGGGICRGDGCGVVYEFSPEPGGKWKETILHRFDNNGKDGYTPGWGALFMDGFGNVYGTTEVGGSAGYGSLFKLTRGTKGGWKETILHNFSSGSGGNLPNAGVVMDKAGNLYGATPFGGGPSGCGVLYKLAPTAKHKWKYSVLHTFGTGYDGCVPEGNLTIDSEGNLYGGTVLGGTTGNGIVFELTP